MNSRRLLTTGSALGMCTAVAAISVLNVPSERADARPAAMSEPPQVLYLTGIVRDFIERSKPNGHPDMERQPSLGFGLYCRNVSPTLGDDGRPAYVGNVTPGRLVNTQWRDGSGRPICWNVYTNFPPGAGQPADLPPTLGGTSTGGITSVDSFSKWFDDVVGTNMSQTLTLTLVRSADGSYVFDDKLDPYYANRGGFFPIDNQLLGNSGGNPQHNYHFTLELHTQFTYDADANQTFKFIGDDDVWVYIDGKLVIDLGGVHAAKEQFISLNRLGLQDGQTYNLDFFFAERHRTQSNFRIQTNLQLTTDSEPSITAAYD